MDSIDFPALRSFPETLLDRGALKPHGYNGYPEKLC